MIGLKRGTVELNPHQPEWKQFYQAETERLQSIAGDRLLDFEHIGSTSIKGLAAKPIIDLLAVVEDLETANDLIVVLEKHEYRYRGTVRNRLFFVKGPASNRTHYLSLTGRDNDFYRRTIAFRDYLRTHPDAAAEYEELKRELASKYPESRDVYTEQKSEFIEGILDRTEY